MKAVKTPRVKAAKKRSEQHLIDAAGIELLKQSIPPHWVLREYRPDYGLDYSLEIFAEARATRGGATYETLGEHLFMQLKSSRETTAKPLRLFGRVNVEKSREELNKGDCVGELLTIRYPIETSELVTIERMGVGVPVLLVVADLAKKKCHFVCLNDYIDKILTPRENYAEEESKTIHVPLQNEVGTPDVGHVALRWYAKRAKLYAAFQRFVYQAAELEYTTSRSELTSMANHFASRIANYDFWDDTEIWSVIKVYDLALRRFIATGDPGLVATVGGSESKESHDTELAEFLHRNRTLQLWKALSLLSRVYEDVCREWYLPTALGYLSTYTGKPHGVGSADDSGVVKFLKVT
jgi:hypothetical protein